MSWFFGAPRPLTARSVNTEDWVPLVRGLRRVLGSDLLWLRLGLPGGAAWVEASGAVGVRAPGGYDAFDRPGGGGPIPRAALPDGWRAGVRVPLRGADGREAGCLLLGWTRRGGRLRASRLDPEALDGAARTLGALWADACAARERDEERSLLLASALHELHGPLTAIRGHAQLVQDALPRGEDAAESLEAILDAEETLRRIVGDLAPLAGAAPTAPSETTPEPVDVASLLRRILRSVPSIAARTVTEVPPGLTVCADPVRLRQCLLVVLGNAEKHAPSGRIDISAHADGASSGVISVADQGPGVPEEERELVLRPYHRSAAAGHRPGAGLGLYIAVSAM